MINKISLTKSRYQSWQNCYTLTNGLIELVILSDVGPRIIELRHPDSTNLFAVFPESIGNVGGEKWHNYGGHRFWHAPEAKPRTYYPDNEPVSVTQVEDFVRLTQPTESANRVQKEIDIWINPEQPHAKLTHRLYNHNPWTIELAPWALSVMAPGGKVLIPLPPRAGHENNLLPTSTVTLWAYTDMSDPRWTWGKNFVMLRQDSQATTPQKAGYTVPDGWAAYVLNDQLFIKTFSYDPAAEYPDLNSNVETFTNNRMLEVETLGPLTQIQPGDFVEHTENWWLFQNFRQPETPEALYASVQVYLQQINNVK